MSDERAAAELNAWEEVLPLCRKRAYLLAWTGSRGYLRSSSGWSQGRIVTTDAENRAALTFQVLQDGDGNTLDYIETKFGGAAAKYKGSFQQEQDAWLCQNMGLTWSVISNIWEDVSSNYSAVLYDEADGFAASLEVT